MKILYTALAAGFVSYAGSALAQTTPTNPPPPPQSTQPSMPSDSSGQQSSNGMSMSAKHAAMKSCIAQQRQTNPDMSKHDARKACKAQMQNGG
jgi:hypothetical protein